jgi:hypothetical protein
MPTSDVIWVQCNICRTKHKAKIEADCISELIEVRADVRRFFICESCLNDPDNTEKIKNIIMD